MGKVCQTWVSTSKQPHGTVVAQALPDLWMQSAAARAAVREAQRRVGVGNFLLLSSLGHFCSGVDQPVTFFGSETLVQQVMQHPALLYIVKDVTAPAAARADDK